MPNELVKAIQKYRKAKNESGDKKDTASASKLPKGSRNTQLTRIAGSIRRQGYDETVILTVLNGFNHNFCDPPLRESEVEQIARSVSRYNPEHDDLFTVMADVVPRDVTFLWSPYFVRGAVNLLEGDGNVGKTYFLCWLTAMLSSGNALPGARGNGPARCVVSQRRG